MLRSCSGCIIRFDKRAGSQCAENFFLLIGPDSGGKSRFPVERRKSNLPFYSFALDFAASRRAILFRHTIRQCRCGRRLFQESWSINLKSFPTSAGDQSAEKEDDKEYLSAADVSKIKCSRGVPDSTRTSNQSRPRTEADSHRHCAAGFSCPCGKSKRRHAVWNSRTRS